MNVLLYNVFILNFILNIFHAESLKLTINKIHNKNLLTRIFRPFLNENKTTINTYSDIPVLLSKEGLYSITIKIGYPNQQFSLLLDTGSPYLWVNDVNCKGCKSENKFISSLSNTFNQSIERIKLNYLSGEISGNICTDYIEFNSTDSKIPNFNFILINETNINYEFEGFFGLSKGSIDIQNLPYSTIYQMHAKKFIKQNIFLFDFPKNNFYIGEIPSFLKKDKYNSFSFKNLKKNKYDGHYWHCLFEKLIFNNNKQIINTNSSKYNYIFFDSGINCLILPLNYTYTFENIISNNKLLKNSECFIENEKNKIYSLNCKNNINNLVNG